MDDLYPAALRRAALLCGATVLWNLTVGVTAVVWRFRAEACGRSSQAERVERLALRVAGAAFTIVAVYLLVQGTRSLVSGKHAERSLFGIAEALAALAVLPYLAVSK